MERIVSVGDSLLNNLLHPSAELHKIFGMENVSYAREISVMRKNLATMDSDDRAEFDFAGLKFGYMDFRKYVEYFQRMLPYNIKARQTGKGVDLLPIEVSHLYLTKEKYSGKITFLCTDTGESIFCAYVVREFADVETNIVIIPETNYHDPDNNWDNGMLNLRRYLDEFDSDTIILRSGGHREFCAYLLLFCGERSEVLWR